MYRKIDDFISDYKMESENTLKVFSRIDFSKKAERVNENVRSPERLAWHITQSLSEMMMRTGLSDKDDLENLPIPENFDDIVKTYKDHVARLLDLLKFRWHDDELEELMNFFGEKYSKGFLLRSVITHEIHHRAQLSIVMRLLGMPVPGVYGPSKEEWVKYNMPAME